MPAQTIIAPPSTAALFLVFTVDETAPEAIDTVRDLFADFPGSTAPSRSATPKPIFTA